MRRLTVLRLAIAALLAAPAAPAAAGDGVVTRDGNAIVITFTDAGDSLFVVAENPELFPNGNLYLDENRASTTLTDSAANCTQVGDDVRCARAGATVLRVHFNGGDDFSEIQQLTSVDMGTDLRGGDGADSLWGSEKDDRIDGGAGADELLGFRGDDVLVAGPGDDILDGYEGADDVSGGDGLDLVTLTFRDPHNGVRVSLDDVADDGVQGGAEGDNVRSDVEDLDGTPFDDVLIGSDRGNVLWGGGGNDTIDGRAGGDRYDGASGDDTLLTRDGAPERVECAEGTDTVTADDIDEPADCETVNASPELQTDVDGDGAARPADCDDGNAAVRPGATEIPDNGLDDDCAGGDGTNLDRDGDGSARPFDCDDTSAAVRPGAREVRGNRVDEDCNGRADPFRRILSTIANRWAVFGGVTRALQLAVQIVPKHTTITVRCRGRGCPFAKRKRVVRKTARRVNLKPLVRRARLRPGATLEIRMTRPGYVAKVVRYRTARRSVPRSRTLCIDPGKRKAYEC